MRRGGTEGGGGEGGGEEEDIRNVPANERLGPEQLI